MMKALSQRQQTVLDYIKPHSDDVDTILRFLWMLSNTIEVSEHEFQYMCDELTSEERIEVMYKVSEYMLLEKMKKPGRNDFSIERNENFGRTWER